MKTKYLSTPATGANSSHHCPSTVMLSGVPNCLPSGNTVLQVWSLQGVTFIGQTTGDINTYDYNNKIFISSGEIYHITAEGLHGCAMDQYKKVKEFSFMLDIQNTY